MSKASYEWVLAAEDMAGMFETLPDDFESALKATMSLCAYLCASAEAEKDGAGVAALLRVIRFLTNAAEGIDQAVDIINSTPKGD